MIHSNAQRLIAKDYRFKKTSTTTKEEAMSPIPIKPYARRQSFLDFFVPGGATKEEKSTSIQKDAYEPHLSSSRSSSDILEDLSLWKPSLSKELECLDPPADVTLSLNPSSDQSDASTVVVRMSSSSSSTTESHNSSNSSNTTTHINYISNRNDSNHHISIEEASHATPHHPSRQHYHRPQGRSRSHRNTSSTLSGDFCLDHSHLRPGTSAALLSYTKSIEMYRDNCRRTRDPNVRCNFAIFLVAVSHHLPDGDSLLDEAEKILKRLAFRGHVDAQYHLATLYASGITHPDRLPDHAKAFSLIVQAAKHSHADAAFWAARCYEDGLGTRRDHKKAIRYYRKAAVLSHPGAMYRLGRALVYGETGQARNVRDGHKWLKRAAEAATSQYPFALHELGRLHERGLDGIVFPDSAYATRLYRQAAALGYAESACRLGEAYEFGELDCSPDPITSLRYYSMAAHQGDAKGCFAMTTWYLVGIPGEIDPSDELALTWARRAAERQLPKAVYAVGYFYDVGIGCEKDLVVAAQWYRKADQLGVKRASQRLSELSAMGIDPPPLSPLPSPISSPLTSAKPSLGLSSPKSAWPFRLLSHSPFRRWSVRT